MAGWLQSRERAEGSHGIKGDDRDRHCLDRLTEEVVDPEADQVKLLEEKPVFFVDVAGTIAACLSIDDVAGKGHAPLARDARR